MEAAIWKKCSTCKKPIGFGDRYQACNVSTCNQSRTGLAFCSVECWDAHLPVMNHRSAWSEEKRAPSQTEWNNEPAGAAPPAAARVAPKKEQGTAMTSSPPPNMDNEILVVASKLKAYIRAKSGMNTSADVLEVLSDKLRNLADEGIVRARQEGRKTVMARDFR